MNWLQRLYKKDHIPKTGHVVREAFTVKGRTFFEMDDMKNQPYQRAVVCLKYYAEFDQRVEREYLLKHVEAVNNLLQLTPGIPVDLYKVKRLNDNLSDRLKWIIDTDLAYKLASVVFFDRNEDPTTYDEKYNAEKIQFWKDNMPATDFFFQLPLKRLIPFLDDVDFNFQTYMEVTERLKDQYLSDLSKIS